MNSIAQDTFVFNSWTLNATRIDSIRSSEMGFMGDTVSSKSIYFTLVDSVFQKAPHDSRSCLFVTNQGDTVIRTLNLVADVFVDSFGLFEQRLHEEISKEWHMRRTEFYNNSPADSLLGNRANGEDLNYSGYIVKDSIEIPVVIIESNAYLWIEGDVIRIQGMSFISGKQMLSSWQNFIALKATQESIDLSAITHNFFTVGLILGQWE
ncbi:hypothetical protein GYB22_04620 [bacterium]|nr:hypothetical protein [bacterium]